MIRQALASVTKTERIKNLSQSLPAAKALVHQFVAGERTVDAVAAAADVTATGRLVTIDRLDEPPEDLIAAGHTRDEYLTLLEALHANGLTAQTEISLKMSALGQFVGADGDRFALDAVRKICERADAYGTAVTVESEDHTTTDATLEAVRELRTDFPDTAAVLQACLYRTEADAADLAGAGSRVRLCKGAFAEPESVAYQSAHDVALSFVRCMKTLFSGEGYPMIATHDPRLVEIAQALAVHNDRPKGTYENQMLLGIRTEEQQRLAEQGEKVRVYVPYGPEWYAYVVRRLAERPGDLRLLLSRRK